MKKQIFKPALAFHMLTPFYDTFINIFGFGQEFANKVLKLTKIKSGEKILDVGMGTGVLLTEAVKQYPDLEISGIDPDKSAISIAQNKLNKIGKKGKLIVGFAQSLPFEDKSFDVVTSTLVFHHLSPNTKRSAIREIYRVLKNDGRFLLADFGKPKSFLGSILLYIGSIFDGQESMRANLSGMLPGILEEAGFDVNEANKPFRGVQFLLAKKSGLHINK